MTDVVGGVPQADVVERRLVGLDRRVGDRRRSGEGVDLDVVEIEGRAGRLDVALDVGRLEGVLVGAHLQRLKDRRVEHADHERDEEPEPDRHRRQ
jgi:hypothetical protein